jgi:iron complex outermembrane receptor protein
MMTIVQMRSCLLAGSALVSFVGTVHAAETPASVPAPAAADAPASDAPNADPQNTTANQAGQANDRQSLTTSDIIVTGSKTADAARSPPR